MCMDGMKVKRQVRAALSQCEDVNKSSSATTDGHAGVLKSASCARLRASHRPT